MPNRAKKRSRQVIKIINPAPAANGTPKFSISYAGIAAIASLLAVGGYVYKITSVVATKDDLNTIETTEKGFDARLRNVERAIDRFFGSKSSTYEAPDPTGGQLTGGDPRFLRAALHQAGVQNPPRPPVVPIAFIERYKLMPSSGGGYQLPGDDGKRYNADDVLRILIVEDLTHHQAPK